MLATPQPYMRMRRPAVSTTLLHVVQLPSCTGLKLRGFSTDARHETLGDRDELLPRDAPRPKSAEELLPRDDEPEPPPSLELLLFFLRGEPPRRELDLLLLPRPRPRHGLTDRLRVGLRPRRPPPPTMDSWESSETWENVV